MAQKKAVFLFGAGAVLDWGAPKTICSGNKLEFLPDHGSDKIRNRVCCLTHLIISTGFFSLDHDRVTNKIFKALVTNVKSEERPVNFETVISILEDLYNYWASKNEREPNSIFSIAALDNLIDQFYFFYNTEPDPKTGLYSISIPGFDLLKEDFISEELHPIQKYYEMFLNNILQGIHGHVSKYSYYTSNHNVIFNEYNELCNKQFCEWMKKFVGSDYSLRMYTLNYDRMFKVLLEMNGLKIFEGFDLNGLEIKPGERLPINLKRIVSDFNSHVYYNLHGSTYWGIKNENINNLPGYEYYLSGVPESNTRAAILKIEKGKTILLTNVITGYQKVQKTSVAPFRQMLSAFDKDCCEADSVYIIGYSFGDEHINDIIRNARKYNSHLEVFLINPSFDDEKFMFDFLLHWGVPSGMIYKNNGKDEIISPQFNVRIITKKFGDFLSEQARPRRV